METALNQADGIVVLEFPDERDEHDHARDQRFLREAGLPQRTSAGRRRLGTTLVLLQFALRRVPECVGLGIRKEVDPDLVVPDPERTLAEGAVAPWSAGHHRGVLHPDDGRAREELGFDVDTPWRKLPAKARKAILEGSDHQVHVRYRNRYGRTRSYYADFEGVLAFLERKMEQTESSR